MCVCVYIYVCICIYAHYLSLSLSLSIYLSSLKQCPLEACTCVRILRHTDTQTHRHLSVTVGLELVMKKVSKGLPFALENRSHPEGNTACVTNADTDNAPAFLIAAIYTHTLAPAAPLFIFICEKKNWETQCINNNMHKQQNSFKRKEKEMLKQAYGRKYRWHIR